MVRLRDEQRWGTMLWQARKEARGGRFVRAVALIDLVQVEAASKRDRCTGREQRLAVHTMDAAVSLRRSMRHLR